MSEQAHLNAILTVLNAALPAGRLAYDVDDVPSTRPSEYVELQLVRRFGGDTRSSGHKSITGYRLTVYGISQTSANNARLLLDKCNTALEYQRIAVGAGRTTSIQFETANPVLPDEGWFSGFRDYVYTIERTP